MASSLPRNVEIFEVPTAVLEDGSILGPGWYFWYCFPGCIPDSEPFGPYDIEADAEAAAIEETADPEADPSSPDSL